MKNSKLFAVGSALAVVAGAQAVLFTDAAGDVAVPGNPFPHMDILSVNVTNTASSITFDIALAGSPIATNWGKYNMVARKVGASPLDTGLQNNPWARNYQLMGGSNAFIGSWVDQPSSNQQNWTFNGSWNLVNTVSNTVTATNVILTSNLADLGLAVGDQIVFDVVTTGGNGGDTAVDSLTGPVPAGWGDFVSLHGEQYNITAVPEPATMAVLGLGAAALIRRRRK